MSRFRALFAVVLILSAAAWAAEAASEMTVQVRETSVRATASPLGKVLAKLTFGTKVTVLSTKNGWARIALPKGEGWVSLSALTGKPVSLSSGDQNVSQSASSEEVALASKGFTPEVEAEYKEEKKLDYTWVDRMGGYVVTTEQVATFALQGGLSGLVGGAQ